MLALLLLLTAAPPEPLEEVPATRLIYLPGRFEHRCPSEVEVQEGISRRLGRAPFAEPAERIVVLALEGDGDGPERARSELFDGQMESLGARVLESTEGCTELVEAAQLAISIALAPSLALAAPVAPPEPIEPRPVEEPVEIVDEAPVIVEETPYMSWMPAGSRLRIGGGSHGSLFFGPQPAGGFQVSASFANGPFELSLEQKNDLPRWDGGLGLLHGGGMNTLLACGEYRMWEGFGALFCGTGSLGSVWSLGSVIGMVPYAGVGTRVAASWTEWDHDVLRLWAQLEYSIVRPSFAAFSDTELWEQESPVTLLFGFTYEIAWP